MGERVKEAEGATEYYANGKVKFRGAKLGDQMHGPWEFFRTDGSIGSGKVVEDTKF